MKKVALLNEYLKSAPPAPCVAYDSNDTVICVAKGAAKNKFPLKCSVAAVALETDGSAYRFPPTQNLDACDWCVFSVEGHSGCFIELKGSDYTHALNQLKSTMRYMKSAYQVMPQRAIAVLSGAHPSNVAPGKANAQLKFKREFSQVKLCERSRGQAKPEDVLI